MIICLTLSRAARTMPGMSSPLTPGTLCPQCPHPLSEHGRRGKKRGVRCLVESCAGLLIPPLVDDDQTPVLEPEPVPLAQDQREADLAEVAVRLRAAVVDGHYAQVEAIARACWDAGFTAHFRRRGAP